MFGVRRSVFGVLLMYSIVILTGLSIAIPVISQIELSQKYYPIYNNKTMVIPVYKDVIEKTEYQCVLDNKTKTVSTCSKDVITKEFDKMMTITVSSKIIGYSDGSMDIIGYVSENKGIITRWEYDIKGRNLKDHPSCVQYEKDRGFCNEIN